MRRTNGKMTRWMLEAQRAADEAKLTPEERAHRAEMQEWANRMAAARTAAGTAR